MQNLQVTLNMEQQEIQGIAGRTPKACFPFAQIFNLTNLVLFNVVLR
jgi:hypothetical protein